MIRNLIISFLWRYQNSERDRWKKCFSVTKLHEGKKNHDLSRPFIWRRKWITAATAEKFIPGSPEPDIYSLRFISTSRSLTRNTSLLHYLHFIGSNNIYFSFFFDFLHHLNEHTEYTIFFKYYFLITTKKVDF